MFHIQQMNPDFHRNTQQNIYKISLIKKYPFQKLLYPIGLIYLKFSKKINLCHLTEKNDN